MMFIEISKEFLGSIATDSDRIPTLYYSQNIFIRRFFWMRLRCIYSLILKSGIDCKNSTCLDFGGGGGVFLPTLSMMFKNVTCVDLENDEAAKVVDKYKLHNVILKKIDINTSPEIGKFDVVVAADVLEHFKDLTRPVTALKMWLTEGGQLYTSLPTENYIYLFLRKFFHIEKPFDHYHSGDEVESFLESHGFLKQKTTSVPFMIKFMPLFFISSWRLK